MTGVYVPDGVDGGKLVAYLRDKMGVAFAGGQDQLKGKIVRIAHLGYMGAFDIVTAIAALEMALRHFGHRGRARSRRRRGRGGLLAALPE